MTDRKKKKRRLEDSGLRHAAGWVHKEDKPKFDKLVEKAVDKVVEVLKDDT